MSYPGKGEISAVLRSAAEAPVLDGGSNVMRLVAPASVTRRQFGLFRRDMQPHAGGADPHFHRTFSESFYVLDGAVRFFDGDRWFEGHAGDFVYVPKGGIHAFKADTDQPSSMLILFAPGTARERFFREAAEIRRSGRELSAEEWAAFYARHDQTMV